VGGLPAPVSPIPRLSPDDGYLYWVRLARLNGPYHNEALQLIEYRYSIAPTVTALYLSPDPSYQAPVSRERPFAKCAQFAITGLMDGRRQCESVGLLSSDVQYKYEFSEVLLPEWREIDEAIRAFLSSMTTTAQ
jgi:hypothetical protein